MKNSPDEQKILTPSMARPGVAGRITNEGDGEVITQTGGGSWNIDEGYAI